MKLVRYAALAVAAFLLGQLSVLEDRPFDRKEILNAE